MAELCLVCSGQLTGSVVWLWLTRAEQLRQSAAQLRLAPARQLRASVAQRWLTYTELQAEQQVLTRHEAQGQVLQHDAV